METTMSFAPLAARLAARADEIRPVDGAEATWANFMALFVCAILQMLILLCEALDARAAADARLLAAPLARDAGHHPVLAVRPRHPAMPGAGRVLRLVRADDAPATPLTPDAALAETAEPHPENHSLAWSPPRTELLWRPPATWFFWEKEASPYLLQHVNIVTIP